jgi:chromosome segregation ATPase
MEDDSDQVGFAPLSQAQTIALVKNLESEIRRLETISTETQRQLRNTIEEVNAVKQKSYDDQVQALRSGIADAKISISKVQSELNMNVQKTESLTDSCQIHKDNIQKLEEHGKMVETRLDIMSKDLQQQRDAAKVVEDDIGNRVTGDLLSLRNTCEQISLSVDQISKEQRQLEQLHKDGTGSLSAVDTKIESILTEVSKSNAVINILESRLASTAKGVQQNWTKLAELSDGSTKLNDISEKMRFRIGDSEGQIKQLGEAIKQAHGELDEAARQIERNSDRLSQALRLLDEQSVVSDETRHQLNSLRQNGESTTKRITQMSKEIEDVSASAQKIKAGLKETTALLLPNIHQASDEVQTAIDRHGSLLSVESRSKVDPTTHSLSGQRSSLTTPHSASWT